ncbi:MAG: TetR/AcrR family transcriptional regulator [Sulfitobacter sp.]
MARPIEFDHDHVLDQALSAFWNLGYAGCSFQDLTTKTGMSRQSIYNAFGDKDGFFQATVAHYKEKVAAQLRPLNAPTAEVEDIRAFITESLKAQESIGTGACFLVITAFGPKAREPQIQSAIEEGAALVRTGFENALIVSQADIKDQTPQDFAAYLYCLMNGLSALLQTGGHPAQAQTALDQIFQPITPNKGDRG